MFLGIEQQVREYSCTGELFAQRQNETCLWALTRESWLYLPGQLLQPAHSALLGRTAELNRDDIVFDCILHQIGVGLQLQ